MFYEKDNYKEHTKNYSNLTRAFEFKFLYTVKLNIKN